MKIVMLCDLYDERAEYQENLLARYYEKHGHSVTVIAATFLTASDYVSDRYDPRKPRTEHWNGSVRVIRLPYALNLLNRLRRFGGVSEILRNEQPDLIFVHDIHLNLREAAQYKRARPETRLVMDYHADYSNSASNWLSLTVLHGAIRKRFFYRYQSAIDQIYAVVPTSATFLHEVYGVPRERISLLPLGTDIDLARRTRAEQSGAPLRQALGIPSTAIVVFTGGKLNPLKKTHTLLEAFRLLEDPNLHLLIVGDLGPSGSAYRERLEGLAAGDPRIHVAGWVDGREVYKFMNACDLAVFPASQSVLWQQALSMGLPLIVGQSKNQDCSYLNLHNGLIILPEEATSASLATEVRRLVDDRKALAARQAAALRTADDLLDYNQIVRQTLAGGEA